MGTAFDDGSLIKDKDGVRIADRAQPMRDHNPRACEMAQILLNYGLGYHIQMTRRFIQQEDSRTMRQGARQG